MTKNKFFSASLRKMVCHKAQRHEVKKCVAFFLSVRPAMPFGRALESLWLKTILYKIVYKPFKILV